MKPDLRVNIAGVEFETPIMTASGCCGYGEELATIFPLSKLGALVTKSITRNPRLGHKPPRVAESSMSMLNAIGLANVGIDAFVADKMPFLDKQRTKVIVNVAGWSVEDYTSVCARLNEFPRVDMIELNFSCPNVENGMEFSSDAKQMEYAVREVKKVFTRPLIAKLSPNVTNIVEIAKGAEQGGANAVSLINSLVGTAIDIETWRPRLTNNTGGLTGPAIKPIALAMVNKVYNHCKLPIIGIGGIRCAEDVVEFLLCGATAVQVGTALFVEPDAPVTLAKGLGDYMKRKRIATVQQLVGKVVRY